jgi:hypothetical protein
VCQSQKSEKAKQKNKDDGQLYRRQYIREQKPFESDSFTATTSTFMSSFPNSITPVENVPEQFTRLSPNPGSPSLDGSILAYTFTRQELFKNDSFYH